MAKGFSIMDIMNEMSKEETAAKTETIEKVSVFDIQPNKDNFYKMDNIEQLKNSIYAMGGVQQNLLLVKLPSGSKFKYKILAGHRRTKACMELVQEGHKEFEHVPAVIRKDIDKDTEDTLLIMTNSTQRELTDWEKVMQHMKLKEIIPKLRKRQGLDGKTRTLEADYLGVSEAQIAIYNTIGTKLDTWLMGVFRDGNIGISLAYEAAKLEPELQKQLGRITLSKGSFTEDDIKKLIGSRPIKGQLKIAEKKEEAETEKVSESDTFEKRQSIPVHAPAAEKKEEPEQTDGTESIETVSKSDTVGEHPAAVDEEDEKQEVKFRGGYELFLVRQQIWKYEEWLKMAEAEDIQNLVCEYKCLLDALELLKAKLD